MPTKVVPIPSEDEAHMSLTVVGKSPLIVARPSEALRRRFLEGIICEYPKPAARSNEPKGSQQNIQEDFND